VKRLIQAAFVIALLGVATIGLSSAFFSDTETSEGNVLAAGAIDLLIDNESYYNGVFNQGTSWELKDLTDQLFFDFNDIKPSDYGEDTISIHVNDNDAWACMDVTLTKNDDNTCTEPELIDDPACTEPDNPEDPNDGELAQNVNFIWWADDGDNVLEAGENIFEEGNTTTIFTGEPWVLADATANVWDESPTPLEGGKDYFIAKAWCFGTLTPAPLVQGTYDGPHLDNNQNNTAGEPADGGYLCDGSGLNNASQTDILTADVSFQAVQSRNNLDFLCGDGGPTPTPGPCEKKPDVMLVLDRSGSISDPEETTLKSAANAFIDALNPSLNTAHIGQTSFANFGSLDLQLTDDATAAHTAVNALSTTGFTNLFEGLSLADDELASVRDRADLTSPDFAVVITDGEPNEPGSDANARAVAAAEAADMRSKGITIYVVGIGVTPANATYLTNSIASPGAGHYFAAADFDDLEAILEGIANCPQNGGE